MSGWYRRAPARCDFVEGSLDISLPGADRMLRLDARSVEIWDLLEYPATPDAIARTLAVDYDAGVDAIRADVDALLSELLRRGLVAAANEPSPADVWRNRYLALLKRAVVNAHYPESELRIAALSDGDAPADALGRARFLRDIRRALPDAFEQLRASQRTGGVWRGRAPRVPHTRLGLAGLDHLERCAETIFADGVAGDFVEAGVCAGGAAIFMRALQCGHQEEQRRVWAADSFAGAPAASAAPDVAEGVNLSEPDTPWLACDLDTVQEHFRRYGLLDDNVRFLRGWFSETLPAASIEAVALLRIDGVLYQSTRDVLAALYDKVSVGGFVIVDDYWFAASRLALDEFRTERGIDAPLLRADAYRAYWRKGV